MTSDPPNKLKGYRWPVRGGLVDTYYGRDSERAASRSSGKRVHDGLVITWFEGAPVKAAHKGTVVAAGRDWARHVGLRRARSTRSSRYERRAAKKRQEEGQEGAERSRWASSSTTATATTASTPRSRTCASRPATRSRPARPSAGMSRAEGKQMMRYRLVRMDGPPMKVHQAARERGYPRLRRANGSTPWPCSSSTPSACPG